MKLKGKLIANFATVILLALTTFGLITYLTIEDSSKKGTDQIIRLHNSILILRLQNIVEHATEDILLHIDFNESGKLTYKPNKGHLRQTLEKDASRSELINDFFLHSRQAGTITPLRFPHEEVTISPDLIKKITNSRVKKFILDNDRMYLFFPMAENKFDTSLIFEINKDYFKKKILSLLEIDNSILFISQDNVSIFPPLSNKADLHVNIKEVEEIPVWTEDVGFSDFRNFGRKYNSPEPLYGAHLAYLVPKSFYYSSLISLKNRLITALLIVGWCSIWVILILAHKITNPLRQLTKLTKDVVAFDYSNKLGFKPSSDELGDLAQNFETMRKKLKEYISKDPLTGVYNRRFLLHIFDIELKKITRLKEKLSCIMLDIDYFKKVNDKYGHQAGDEVLKEVGKILMEHTRDYDTPARYGGEEFLLVLPETDLRVAEDIAERIRKTVEELTVVFDGQEISTTVSLGISTFSVGGAQSCKEIINKADVALYRAKAEGRNRVVIEK